MSLYRRGRIWWIELSAKSGRVRESAGTTDKREAQEYHEKRKGELWRQDKLGEAPPVTWGEAVAKWLGIRKRPLQDRYLIGAMRIDPKSMLPLAKESLETSLPSRTPSTFNRYLSLVVAIHNVSGVKPPEIDRRKDPPGRTRWLTKEEWDRLRTCLEEQSPLLRQCAEFTLATGLRENNVLELEWSQIDLRRRVAWLHGDRRLHSIHQVSARTIEWVKKAVAWLPMHACFITGDLAARALDRLPDWEAPPKAWLASALYRIYNRCMCWSVDLNDWAGFSLWRK
jgi:integrase